MNMENELQKLRACVGSLEAVIATLKPARTDPPRHSWPEPPAGCRWSGRSGRNTSDIIAPHGYMLWKDADARWANYLSARVTGQIGTDAFRLIAEPLPEPTREERLEAAGKAARQAYHRRGGWNDIAKAAIAAWEGGQQ